MTRRALLVLLQVAVIAMLGSTGQAWAEGVSTGKETLSPAGPPLPASVLQEGKGFTRRARVNGRVSERDAVAIAVARGLKVAIAREEAVMATADALAASSELGIKATASVVGFTQDMPMIWSTAPGLMPAFLTQLDGRRGANFNVMAMVPLFTGGRLQAMLRGARSTEKAALARLAWELLDTGREARVAYAKAVLAREGLVIASWEVAQQDENVRLAEARLKAGRVAQYVVLRTRAERASARQRENDARAQVEVAMANLKATMGVDLASDLALADGQQAVAPAVGPIEQEMASALTRRPDLLAARHDVAAATQAVQAAGARYVPQVYLQGMGQATYADPMGRWDRGYGVGVVASLPIFDAGERRAGVQRSQADERRRALQVEALEVEVTRQVNEALANLRSALANVELAQEEVTQGEEDLRVARIRFEVGRAVHLEVLDALAALSRARYAQARARQAAAVARADLWRATGRTVEGEQGSWSLERPQR